MFRNMIVTLFSDLILNPHLPIQAPQRLSQRLTRITLTWMESDGIHSQVTLYSDTNNHGVTKIRHRGRNF